MVDGVTAINVVINLAKSARKVCLVFKVDFEKRYDPVSYNFLNYMLIKLSLSDKQRSWIRAYVFSRHLVVLVNDSQLMRLRPTMV